MNDTTCLSAESAPLVEFLRQPAHYPEATRRVEVVETHFAWVFLTDEYAYKLKKRLRQDCMDYRSLAARRRGCNDELRLNRRLAPEVYLELVPIVRLRNGSLELGRCQGARILDWLVKMRRLPADRMLDHALLKDRVTAAEIAGLIVQLRRFFESASRRPMSARGYLARLRRAIRDNHAELSAPSLRLDGRSINAVCEAQLAFITDNARQVGLRAAHLVDGHGDLRPEHVFLGAGPWAPCVIDCLEFSATLRRLDPLEELAFLVLECHRLGSKRVGRVLLTHYRQGGSTPVPAALLYFYMSQRSLTRAKLAIWHLHDPQFARRASVWRALAGSYLGDAAHYIRLASRAARCRRGAGRTGSSRSSKSAMGAGANSVHSSPSP